MNIMIVIMPCFNHHADPDISLCCAWRYTMNQKLQNNKAVLECPMKNIFEEEDFV